MAPIRNVDLRRPQQQYYIRSEPPEIEECSLCTNFNNYATKKSVAQGLVDAALFTANGSKLRTILILRDRHEFYSILVILLLLSLGIQILQAFLILYISFKCNINHVKYHKKATLCNNLITALTTITLIINAIIPIFDAPESINYDL